MKTQAQVDGEIRKRVHSTRPLRNTEGMPVRAGREEFLKYQDFEQLPLRRLSQESVRRGQPGPLELVRVHRLKCSFSQTNFWET